MSGSLATKVTDNNLEQTAARKQTHEIEAEIEYLQFGRMHALEKSKYPPEENTLQEVYDRLKSEVAHRKESRKRSGEEQKAEKDMILMCLTEGKARLAARPKFTVTRAEDYYQTVKEMLVKRGMVGAED